MTTNLPRRSVLKTIGAGLGGLAATGGVASADSGLETVFTYDPSIGELPENIAVDKRGTKYVSFTPRGEIQAITPDYEQSSFADFDVGTSTGLAGLEVHPNGTLYACLITGNAAGTDMHGVWSVAPDGEKSLFAELPPTTFPNDILLHRDSLLVTDTVGGAVLRVRQGEWSVWTADDLLTGTGAFGVGFPVGANGIVRGSDGTVYVANTEKGQLVAIPVESDGSAGTPELFVADPRLFVTDGLGIDTRDTIYAGVNGQDTLVRVTADGTVETLATAADGLDGPADVTFGTSRGEQTTAFVVNFAFFSRATPSLMKLDVGVPGAPIHP